jgi:hypothetical protein
MRAWLKAGILGGILQVALTLPAFAIYVLPEDTGLIVSLCVCLPFFLLYPAIGSLASYWLTPPRTIRQGAITGSLAGLLAASIDGVITTLLSIIIAVMGLPQRYLQQLSPDTLEALRRSGMDSLFTVSGQIVASLCTVPIHILFGVVFGCVGGMLYAAMKKD